LHPTQTLPVSHRALSLSVPPRRRASLLSLLILAIFGAAALLALGTASPAAASTTAVHQTVQTWHTPTPTAAYRSGSSRGTTTAATTRVLNARELSLLAQITSARHAAGLPTLTLNNGLIDLARDRSADMANRRYFDHYTPEGHTFLDMMRQRGLPFRMAGEIIAQNNYPLAQTAAQAYQGFMDSTEHHRIIMMNNWTRVGVGQAVDGSGMYYFTVLFSQPY
jgi:uncharacterized protein YkwD